VIHVNGVQVHATVQPAAQCSRVTHIQRVILGDLTSDRQVHVLRVRSLVFRIVDSVDGLGPRTDEYDDARIIGGPDRNQVRHIGQGDRTRGNTGRGGRGNDVLKDLIISVGH